MTRDEFNAFCGTLAHTSHVVQWGNSDVWKVAGKVFALCGWNDGKDAFTFKVGDIAFEVLGNEPGIRPAPYLASRGMKWIQDYAEPGLSDEDLKAYLKQSHHIVSQGLSKKKRKELGLED